jgi:Domain of unknown function (DUF5658)
MIVLILIGVLCILFNIGDSVSTHYALNHLPDNLKAKESNPFAAGIMSKDPLISDLIKHIGVTMIVFFFIVLEQKALLIEITIMLGLVVLSNTELIIARKITKRKVSTPFGYVCEKLKIKPQYQFFIFVVLIIAVAIVSTHLILGTWRVYGINR